MEDGAAVVSASLGGGEDYFESGGVLKALMYCSVKSCFSKGLMTTSLGKWVSRINKSSSVLANPIFDTSRKYCYQKPQS